jgi:hypothetical protein
VNSNSSRHRRTEADAQAEINRVEQLMDDIGRSEADYKRIRHIKDVVKRLRARVDETSGRVDRVTSSHQSQASKDRHRR